MENINDYKLHHEILYSVSTALEKDVAIFGKDLVLPAQISPEKFLEELSKILDSLQDEFIAYDAQELYENKSLFLKHGTEFKKYQESNPTYEKVFVDYEKIDIGQVALLGLNMISQQMLYILNHENKTYLLMNQKQINPFVLSSQERLTQAFVFSDFNTLESYYKTNFSKLLFVPEISQEKLQLAKIYFEKHHLEKQFENNSSESIKNNKMKL